MIKIKGIDWNEFKKELDELINHLIEKGYSKDTAEKEALKLLKEKYN